MQPGALTSRQAALGRSGFRVRSCIQSPSSGRTFEFVVTERVEPNAGANDQVRSRARDPDLRWSRDDFNGASLKATRDRM